MILNTVAHNPARDITGLKPQLHSACLEWEQTNQQPEESATK